MTATSTFGAVLWIVQPASALMSAPGVPPVWPVLLRLHCWLKYGSSGTVSAFRIRSGSAYWYRPVAIRRAAIAFTVTPAPNRSTRMPGRLRNVRSTCSPKAASAAWTAAGLTPGRALTISRPLR